MMRLGKWNKQIVGTVSLALLAGSAAYAGDLTVEGDLIVTSNVTAQSYSGPGSGLTDVDAAELEGLSASDYVRIDHSGNTGDVSIVGNFTLGSGNSATGSSAFAQGVNCEAGGTASHAEGSQTDASGLYAHAEGVQTIAAGSGSHAEGYQSEASGWLAHAEGYGTDAIGAVSHAEGNGSMAAGYASYAGGGRAMALHDYAYVWSDSIIFWEMEDFESTADSQYSVRALNGVRFVVGTNAAVTINDHEVATLAYIPPQGDLSMGGFTNGLPQL